MSVNNDQTALMLRVNVNNNKQNLFADKVYYQVGKYQSSSFSLKNMLKEIHRLINDYKK